MAGQMRRTGCYLRRSANYVVLVVLLAALHQASHQNSGHKNPVTDLRDGENYVFSGSNRFCYQNTIAPTWRQTWTRVLIKVWSSEVFKVVIVDGEEQLQDLEKFSIWGWFQSVLHDRHNETIINIDLFSKKTCFKIDPVKNSQFTVKSIRKFDIYLFLVFLAGMLLFFLADSLSRSHLFFYSAGMSTGMIASLVILFFVLARLLPKKSPFYLLILGGWSFSVYAIQFVFRNLSVILQEHWHLALGYLVLVGFISFAVCYRYGPLVDEKNINILTWTLQLLGLLCIYLGIQIQQVAFAIIIAALISKNLEYPVALGAAAWGCICRKIRRVRQKPSPRPLLTEEEYQKQAEEETRRGLEELRKHCNSPDFSPWKTVSRLQSPKRFADFVEGSPHLMPNEVSMHVHEYGFGGSLFEGDFFDTDDDDDDDSNNYTEDDEVKLSAKRPDQDPGAGDVLSYSCLRPAA
ncbi:nuclear envelope integral membrane protein 1 [Takifugu flavidus]|uniref:Nuclear envelope integral membrane protein 1a n=1 Tax=Takifugu flavidus TaxID=433684 RepID=A0A5C6MQG8_9TELE|nr:nuclear envelope integral membrane protein 1 [Takifugu flavidus]TWW57005.1 Nuclear envelope integral membrane protein 1a [Takifugu flavidus]